MVLLYQDTPSFCNEASLLSSNSRDNTTDIPTYPVPPSTYLTSSTVTLTWHNLQVLKSNMKCREPRSDREAEVRVLVDGTTCPEYMWPRSNQSRKNTTSCLVPVEDGQKITVQCNFLGQAVSASIDLLLQGVFYNGTHFTRASLNTRAAQSVEFKYAVSKAGRNLEARSIVAQDLTPSRLGKADEGYNKTSGFGAISVVISLCVSPDDTLEYNHDYMTFEDAEIIPLTCVQQPLPIFPRPTHEVTLSQVPYTSSNVSLAVMNATRSHARAPARAGQKPWARFDFYLRSAGMQKILYYLLWGTI